MSNHSVYLTQLCNYGMLNFITQSRIVCSTCSSDRVIHDPESGEVICSSCGMVISDRIQNITMPERRDFKNSETESRRRTGIPVSLARYDMGLATVIANTNRDASGRPLGTEMRARMQRLRTWDLRTSYTYLDKNLTQAFDELDILKDKLALSDAVVEKAAYIYRKVEDRDWFVEEQFLELWLLLSMLHVEKSEPYGHYEISRLLVMLNVKTLHGIIECCCLNLILRFLMLIQ
jgi:hypothetical protein